MCRLMIIEARMKGLPLGNSPERQQADRPDLVQDPHECNDHVSRIPQMELRIFASISQLRG